MRGQHRGDCCRSLLRGSLRALNYLLAIVGVLMVAYALFMYVQWSEASPGPEPPAPVPPPPPHHHHHHPPKPAPEPRAELTVMDNRSAEHNDIVYEKLDFWRADEPDDPPSGHGSDRLAKCALLYARHPPRACPCRTAHACWCAVRAPANVARAFARASVKRQTQQASTSQSTAAPRSAAGTPGSSTCLAAPACSSSSQRQWAS